MSRLENFSPFPVLLEHAAREAGRAAIITPDFQITYGALPERIQAIVDWLMAHDFDPDSMTAVTIPDEVTNILVSVALVCLGTPNIGIGSFVIPEDRDRILDQLEVTQIIAPPDLPLNRGGRAGLRRLYPPLDALPSNTSSDRLMNQVLHANETVYFLSTSGTTGVPKTFGMTTALMQRMIGTIANDPGKGCTLRTSSTEYDSSRLHRVLTLLAGRSAAILQPITAETLSPFCAMAKVTEIHAGTYRLASLLAVPLNLAHRLPAGVRIQTGGSRVPGPLRTEVMKRLSPDLYVSFATSEVGGVSIAKPDEHSNWPEGVGYPLPGVEVQLRGPDGELVPRGEAGELWLRKCGVPGQGTADTPDWVSTGDLLSWPERGPLVFHSRTDDMMIMNGINIFPGPIEDTLTAHPAISEAVAYPVSSAVHGQVPVAAVVLQSDAVISESKLMRYARDHLGLKAPRRINIVEVIPRTAQGKPLLRDLRHN